MPLQADVRDVSRSRGRRILFIVALCAVLLVSAAGVLAALGWSGASGNQVAVDPAAVQEATASLTASGCKVSVTAEADALIPFAELAPAAIQRKLIRIQTRYTVELAEAQLTVSNIERMNQYPLVDVVLVGSTIADASLFELSRLAHPGYLRVEETAVSVAGLTKLKSARPALSIWLCSSGNFVRTFELPPAAAQTAGRTGSPVVK